MATFIGVLRPETRGSDGLLSVGKFLRTSVDKIHRGEIAFS